MSKIMYLIGIPASGKSSFAIDLAKKERAEVLSTDRIRLELFGDETVQKKTSLVYKTLYEKAHALLNSGKNVIIDATNIEREKRANALKYFKDHEKECFYFTTLYETACKRNFSRKRKVDSEKMKKYYMNMQFPSYGEGWDKIHFVHDSSSYNITKDTFINVVQNELPYEKLYSKLVEIPFFKEIYGFDQQNPYHSHTLCLHTYKVFDGVNKNYDFDDKLALQTAALLHDIGKPFCKTYKKTRGYFSYFLHENVSVHMAAHFLCELEFDEEFIYKVLSIIQYHMIMLHMRDEGANEVYHMLGDEMLWKMYMFKDFDDKAK